MSIFSLPSLEVFEVYTGISKLRKVVVHFSRTGERDIVPEALAYAQAAGIGIELELKYQEELSGSAFGLSKQDISCISIVTIDSIS